MKNYAELTKVQKRLVDEFIARRPELADAATITRDIVEELWYAIYAERANGGVKLGYPTWITKGERVERGVYLFPAPNVTHSATPLPRPKTQKELRAEALRTPEEAQAAARKAAADEEFFNELKEAGVAITV